MAARRPEPDEVWVGLDLGTQGGRALAVSGDGEVLASASRGLRGRRRGDCHEQDPAHWWTAVASACAQAPAPVDARAVQGVACCATSGTILLCDAGGEPLTAGLMYDDGRARAEAARVNEVGSARWTALGYRMAPAWGLPKLLDSRTPAGSRRARDSSTRPTSSPAASSVPRSRRMRVTR